MSKQTGQEAVQVSSDEPPQINAPEKPQVQAEINEPTPQRLQTDNIPLVETPNENKNIDKEIIPTKPLFKGGEVAEGVEGHDESEQANKSGKKNNKEDREEKQEEEGGKSARKGSSNQMVESQENEQQNQNDTSQIAVQGGGKRCFNKLCHKKNIYKKIRSKVEVARYRFLCKTCYQNYWKNNFCEFCEQIYSTEEDEDQQKWVGCDQCDRWNHIECQRKFRNPNYILNREEDIPYECLACSKKNRNGGVETEVLKKKPVEREVQSFRARAVKMEIKKEDRIGIFYKKPEPFPCLESFLGSFNFRLWLNDSMIRDDLETLRGLERRPGLEDEEPKKTKKVKLS